jgi:tetratricopeptide (TPR) repeat protein
LVKDLEMARSLQEARLRRTAAKDGHLDAEPVDAAYAAAFQEYGLDVDGLDPQAAAEQIRARSIHRQLVAALEVWARVRKSLKGQGWKHRLAVARAADPDPRRNRLRDALAGEDPKAVEELAAADPTEDWPAPTLVLLGLLAHGTASAERVAVLLERAQQRHPEDFWINEQLGLLHHDSQPRRLGAAIRFYSIAVALRPQSPVAHLNLGAALADNGQLEEAIAEFRAALRLEKDLIFPHLNLGSALAQKGQMDEAIAEFREAIRINKDYAEAHYHLGRALMSKGLVDDAIAEFRQAIQLKYDYASAHNSLGVALYDKGQLDEAMAEYHTAIQIEQNNAEAHNNFGVVLRRHGQIERAIAEFRTAIRIRKDLFHSDFAEAHDNLGLALDGMGQLAEAMTEYRAAIQIKKDYPEAHYHLANALRHSGRPEEAIDHYRAAIRINKDYSEAHNNLGLLLVGKGQLDEAIEEFRAAIRSNKDDAMCHCNLAQALRQKGQFAEALTELRRGHELGSKGPSPWPYPSGQWVKEYERLVELDSKLPEILSGHRKPADVGERLAVASLCQQAKKRYAAAARFYDEAFAEEPQLADNLRLQHRYNAACAAALAGCGQGEDAAGLDDQERVRLRKQARDWLNADLRALRGLPDKDPARVGPAAAKQLAHWLEDTDFAGVRGEESLARLPEAERGDWRKLWQEVEALRQRAARPPDKAAATRP